MVKKVIIILADGVEEIEAVTPIDLLRRAGLQVITLGLESKSVRGSHEVIIQADQLLDNNSGIPDAIILPGGPGHTRLKESAKVLALIKEINSKGKLCAAICAAPTVLAKAGILAGKKATCFPGMEQELTGATFIQEPVVKDGSIITSRGAGTAVPFSLAVIEYLIDKNTADSIASKIVYQ